MLPNKKKVFFTLKTKLKIQKEQSHICGIKTNGFLDKIFRKKKKKLKFV